MTTKTLAIVNQKGGVGKTTTAVTLAHGLAKLGQRALLVDLDAQGNVADALGLEKSGGLYRLLIDKAGRQAVRQSGRAGLGVILSDQSTAQAKAVLIGRPFREQELKRTLDGLEGYDWIVLDVAPGVDVLQISALVAATHYIIPVKLDHLSLVGAGDLLATAIAQTETLGCQFLGVLPTFLDRRLSETKEQLATLAQDFGRLVWEPIPVDAKAAEAPAFGQTLWEYAPHARALKGVEINSAHVGGYEQTLARLLREVG